AQVIDVNGKSAPEWATMAPLPLRLCGVPWDGTVGATTATNESVSTTNTKRSVFGRLATTLDACCPSIGYLWMHLTLTPRLSLTVGVVVVVWCGFSVFLSLPLSPSLSLSDCLREAEKESTKTSVHKHDWASVAVAFPWLPPSTRLLRRWV